MRGFSAFVLLVPLVALGCKRKPEVEESPRPAPAASSAPHKPPRGNRGNLNVTFFVTADTHFGVGVPKDAPANRDPVKQPLGIEVAHREIIRQMNEFEGKKYPLAIGGTVNAPRGLLIAGDLTEKGREPEWQSFRAYYGTNGKDGLLRIPSYEGVGNHDFWEIRQKVKKDRGALSYSWDWDDLHVVCLGEAPDAEDLKFLESDLAGLKPEVPLILFQHFPFIGPYSDTWFTRDGFDDKLAKLLSGRRVLGIFHGHYHGTGHYHWHGIDVYNVGSAKHGFKSFSVVEITDQGMKVAEWNWERRAYWWWHRKPLAKGGPTEVFGVATWTQANGLAPFIGR